MTRVFDGDGSTRLYFREHGPLPGIALTTGLAIKVDTDGDYSFADETVLVQDTDFWLGPWDADDGPEPAPWTFIELHPDSAIAASFPARQRSVEIAAIWGWPAVPSAIERATVHLTAILRIESPRATRRIPEGIDQFVETSRQGQEIVQELAKKYGRKRVMVA